MWGPKSLKHHLNGGEVRNNQISAKSYVIKVERVYALYMEILNSN